MRNDTNAQVAFKGMIELMVANPKISDEISNTVIRWAMERLQPAKPTQQPTPKPVSKPLQSKAEASNEEIEVQEQGETYVMAELKADLETLQGTGLKFWTKANILSYLNVCSSGNHAKISEAFKDLSDNQKQDFLNKVKEAIELI